MQRPAAIAVIIALAVGLAAAGAVPVVDHMTHTVHGIVAPIAWADWWRPYWNPAPMDAWGVRPVSVLLMKALQAVFPPDRLPSPLGVEALGAAQLAAFGLGGWAWLRRWGLEQAALPAALLSMVLSPTLFSAWYLPELDGLGAGLLLGGLALLARPGELGWRWLPTAVLLGAGLFLKESTGLVGLALLATATASFVGRRDWERGLRHGALLLLAGNVWALLARPLLGDDRSMLARQGWLERLPVVEHNAVQLVFLVSAAGTLLVLLGSAPLGARRRGWQGAAGLVLMPVIGLVLLLLAPLVGTYNHYEAVYFTPRAVGTLLAATLAFGLLSHALQVRRAAGRAQAATAILGAWGAVTAASLVASSAREDMASRIFLVTAPLLLGLALDGARRLWAEQAALSSAPRAVGRAAVALLGAATVWASLASGLNTTSDWRARHAVDAPARLALAAHDLAGGLVVFNHYVWWLGAAELQAAGAQGDLHRQTDFVLVPAWLTQPALPTMDWGRGPVAAEDRWSDGDRVWAFWLARRFEGEPTAAAHLLGDLSWTRRNAGLFTPLLAEVDAPRTPDGRVDTKRLPLPLHNLPEDLRFTTWRPGATPLEQLVASRSQGPPVFTSEARAIAVPVDLLGVPRRLVLGVPLVETYRWEARVTALARRSR